MQNMNQWLQANRRSGKYGAPMGNRDADIEPDTEVHIERLDWVDGDYTRDGTYWGQTKGESLYAIWCDVNQQRECIYFRAKSRAEAVDHAVDLDLVPLRGNPRS